jgi:hypothetical protein
MHQNSCNRPLTERDVQEINPVRYARKVTVGGGLFLLVMPPGGRSWRYKYRFGGKCKQLVLGLHPEISLECAKSRHQFARDLVAQGIDPAALKASVGKHLFIVKMRDWAMAQSCMTPRY